MMSENIEIKACYTDLRKAARIAQRLGARLLGVERQRDTYFALQPDRSAAGGRLKLRERVCLSGRQRPAVAHLIPYFRPLKTGPKRSRYAVIPVEDARLIRQLLGRLLGVARIVVKRRTIYLWKNVRIHLDSVRGHGTFIEFEALVGQGRLARRRAYRQVDALLQKFGIAPGDLISTSYGEMCGESMAKPRSG